jgi:hypothetical protein
LLRHRSLPLRAGVALQPDLPTFASLRAQTLELTPLSAATAPRGTRFLKELLGKEDKLSQATQLGARDNLSHQAGLATESSSPN